MQAMRVIAQGPFTTPRDVLALGIVDWGRLNGAWHDIAAALDTVASWLIGKASYTRLDYDLTAAPACDDWPGWQHVGSTHAYLGRLYWNAFHAAYPNGELHFTDEPDFWGVLGWPDDGSGNGNGNRRDGTRPPSRATCCAHVWGDIGRASASCFAMTLKKMSAGDLWVSVLDEHSQVVIEADADLRTLWTEHILPGATATALRSAENAHGDDLAVLFGVAPAPAPRRSAKTTRPLAGPRRRQQRSRQRS